MLILNIFIRFFSLSYDVTLSRILGAEAIGLFEISLSVLMLFSIFVSSGISTSITKLVAENHSKTNHNIDQIFKDALFMNLVTSILLGIFTIFFSKHIALTILKNESMLFGVYLLVPAIIITSISSVYKSYFYGLRNIVVPTIGEIIESLAKLIFVLLIFSSLNPIQSTKGATIAILAICIGELFYVLWCLYCKNKLDNKSPKNYKRKKEQSFIPKILIMSMPLTLSALLSVVFNFINTILLPNKLMTAGYSSSQSLAAIGRIMGMVMPLIGLPFIVTNALVVNLIPSLTEQVAQRRFREIKADIQLSIKVTLLVSVPMAFIYILFTQRNRS